MKSNNQRVPARLYLDAVHSLKGCPRIVRSDCGTENIIIAAMQCYFRVNDNDEHGGLQAHQYGSDHLPQTNALRVGGHFSVEAIQIGGSICLKICVILDFFN